MFTFTIRLRSANYKNHWNILVFYDKWKNNVRFEYVPQKNVWLCFNSIAGVHFSHKTEKFQFWKYWNILIFFDKERSGVRFEYVPWFCNISIVWIPFSHKTKKFWFWKSLKHFNIFLLKKDMVSDLDMSHGKMSNFVSFPLFSFIKILFFFFDKEIMLDLIISSQAVSDLV